jgi:hypothetical protein
MKKVECVVDTLGVGLKIAIWGLGVVLFMLLGDFLISIIGGLLYYGILFGASLWALSYFKRMVTPTCKTQ